MPNRYDSMASTARALEESATRLRESIERRDLATSQPAIHDISDRLDELKEEVYDVRRALNARAAEALNPYRYVRPPGPTLEKGLARLSTEDVKVYCRHEFWRMNHHEDPYGRWWISKHFSAGCRELLARGLDLNSWRDGSEEDAE